MYRERDAGDVDGLGEFVMTTRILPREDWPKLREVGAEIAPALDVLPDGTRIVVIEDGGQIVGSWALIPYVHVEGVWIAESHRKRGRVARRLLHGMWQAARAMGARAVLTAAVTDEVRALITQLHGTRLPGDHYVLPIGGE